MASLRNPAITILRLTRETSVAALRHSRTPNWQATENAEDDFAKALKSDEALHTGL
jgi:hypothetical protein